jgi:hypothetical protein
MLQIEEHEIASGRLENMADTGGRELHDKVPELGSLGSSQLLKPLRCHPSLHHVMRFEIAHLFSSSMRAAA